MQEVWPLWDDVAVRRLNGISRSHGFLWEVRVEPLLVAIDYCPHPELSIEFVANIREHGVLEPIRIRIGAYGRIRYRDGHHRTLAAYAVGLSTISAWVRGGGSWRRESSRSR